MDGTDALYASLKSASPFFLMAGPNVIQSEEHIFRMCRSIKRITDEVGIPLVFKSSFDKANRTSAKSFRGPGMDEGLKILRAAKTTFDVPIVTDVHDACQAEPVGTVADVIQIPAFLCRQTDLLTAAAKTGRIVNVKKGQFCAASVMRNSVEKIRAAGNERAMVCERGVMFGYNDLVVDPRNLVWMRDANVPVVADVTHALQQPAGVATDDSGGVASGGLRELIPAVARVRRRRRGRFVHGGARRPELEPGGRPHAVAPAQLRAAAPGAQGHRGGHQGQGTVRHRPHARGGRVLTVMRLL